MKQLRFFLSVLFLILMFVPAQAQKIDTKVYYRLSIKYTEDSPGVLSIFESKKGKYAPNLKGISTDVSQLWSFVDVGKGFYRLINVTQPLLSLDLAKDPKSKVSLVLAKTKDLPSQHWQLIPLKFVDSPISGFQLSNRSLAGKCIDVIPEKITRFELAKVERSSSQCWMLKKTDIQIGKVNEYVKETKQPRKIDTAVYYRLITGLQDELALDIQSAPSQGNDTPVVKGLSADKSQLWRFVDGEEGFFSLVSAARPDMCLDVINEASPQLVLNKTGGGTGQLWKISPSGAGVGLINHWLKNNLAADQYFTPNEFGGLFLTGDGPYWNLQKTKIRVEEKTDVKIEEKPDVKTEEKFELTSMAFVGGTRMPFEHTSGGANLSPPLAWKGAPAGTKSFMILCTDPDAPSPANPDPNPFVHWFILNIPADTKYLLSGIPRLVQVSTPFGAYQFNNGFGEIGYSGPKPPQGSGKHRYLFTILALDRVHPIDPKMTIDEFTKLLKSSVLGKAELMGTYEIPALSIQDSLLLRK